MTPRAFRMWEVDRKAVEGAKLILGLKYPATVRITSLRDDSARYHGLRGRGKARHHLITLAGDQSTAEANRAIWHELAHAKQRERHSTEAAWQRALKRDKSGKLEAEANAGQKYADRLALVSTREQKSERVSRSERVVDGVTEGLRRIDPR